MLMLNDIDIKSIYQKEINAGRLIAHKYTDAYNTLFFRDARRYVAKRIANKVKKQPLLILDVGCGPGNLTYEIKKLLKGDIYMLDISEDMLKAAVKIGMKHGVCGVIETLPFKSQSIDIVAGFSVLHHLVNLRNAFKEIDRILKPGGFFFFAEPFEIPKLSIWKKIIIYGPYFICYKCLQIKNRKELKVFKETNFDELITEIHRNLSVAELKQALEGLPLAHQVKRFGVITPFLGTSMFAHKPTDRVIYSILANVDYLYSKLFESYTQEGIICGEKLNQ
jgi:ubiquinone/menaquinone biosynthesis C-methylase UbiE